MTLYKSRASNYWNHSSEIDTLVNQHDHTAPIRSPVGERVFQNQGVCGQALPPFPSPTPFLSTFCSHPTFRAARMRKTPSRGPNFVRFVTLATQAIRQKKSTTRQRFSFTEIFLCEYSFLFSQRNNLTLALNLNPRYSHVILVSE